MYKYLKRMLEIAEEIGQVESVRMDTEGHRFLPCVMVEGKTPNGAPFTLELTVKKEEEP